MSSSGPYLDDLVDRLGPVVRDLGLVHGQPTGAEVILSLAGVLLAVWVGVVTATRLFCPASSVQTLGTAAIWFGLAIAVDALTGQVNLEGPGPRIALAAGLLVALSLVTRFTLSTQFGRAAMVVLGGLMFGGIAGLLMALGLRMINAI